MKEIEAIWLNRPVGRKRDGYYARTSRITEGDNIKVRFNAIQYLDADQEPTHRVLGCFGNIGSERLEVMTMRLSDMKLEIINAHKEPNLKSE